jgi:hypothetical protein
MLMPNPYAGWIENLRYHVQVLATPDRIEEVVARVSELSTAYAPTTSPWPSGGANS